MATKLRKPIEREMSNGLVVGIRDDDPRGPVITLRRRKGRNRLTYSVCRIACLTPQTELIEALEQKLGRQNLLEALGWVDPTEALGWVDPTEVSG